MGFLEKILGGALAKALNSLVDKAIAWFKELLRWERIVKRGEEYVKQTKDRAERLELLNEQAKKEIQETGSVSNETREAIRKAGRDLIRGKRN
jgi:hypothetical protein